MIAADTLPPAKRNRQPPPRPRGQLGDDGKAVLLSSPLRFRRDCPEAADDRAGFIGRLERVLDRLVEYPGDLRATRWLLRALEGHHTTMVLAEQLGLEPDELCRLMRTGRTDSKTDDRALVLAYQLLDHLRQPTEPEPLEMYLERRNGSSTENGP